ncbi:DUF192 domain-containing protein [candidate division CSSED10-310 bacterium]|uniref:DUF192 domain-containing protein n=1 Tax=candidate division CSSED10-310 bacterium TaxID=2855610 RepID=A0ABV6YWM1_UNCC1
MDYDKTFHFVNKTKNNTIAAQGWIAFNALQRMRGLLGYENLDKGQGLLLKPGSSIHMQGMKFPLDIIFVDKSMNVVKVVEDLKPEPRWKLWKMIFGGWKAHACLELPVGTIQETQTEVGDIIHFYENIEKLSG